MAGKRRKSRIPSNPRQAFKEGFAIGAELTRTGKKLSSKKRKPVKRRVKRQGSFLRRLKAVATKRRKPAARKRKAAPKRAKRTGRYVRVGSSAMRV